MNKHENLATDFLHRCTYAIAHKKPLLVRTIANKIDRRHTRAWTDDMLFYYFSDGSVAGTCKHNRTTRERNWNCWVVQS